MKNSHHADISRHPCYSEDAHFKYGRLHLPVAPLCNISCGFCERHISRYYHSIRPGAAAGIIKPSQVSNYIRCASEKFPMLRVVGIAGPGEPLYNNETFMVLKILADEFPEFQRCVCTNGLLLPDCVSRLVELDVKYLTVTVNAVKPEIGARINGMIHYRNETETGLMAAAILLDNQLTGIRMAVDSGITVKVNSVLIPTINERHITDIAKTVKNLGVSLMNIMPLIPGGIFKNITPPTCVRLRGARERAEKYIPQFRVCKQCRADACGIPGSEREIVHTGNP